MEFSDPVLDAKLQLLDSRTQPRLPLVPILTNILCLFPTVIWHVFWNHNICQEDTPSIYYLIEEPAGWLHCLQGQDQRSITWPPEPSGLHWLLPIKMHQVPLPLPLSFSLISPIPSTYNFRLICKHLDDSMSRAKHCFTRLIFIYRWDIETVKV